MEYTIDKIISLVYSWLKEKHLLKASRALEQEYGQDIVEQSGPTLDNIIQTYQSLALLLSSFNSQIQKTENTSEHLSAESSNTASDVSKENNKSTTKTESNTKNTNKIKPTSIANEVVPKVVKKKEIKKPFKPFGEWFCPEMEDALCRVYEKTKHLIVPVVRTVKDEVTTVKDEVVSNEVNAGVVNNVNNVETMGNRETGCSLSVVPIVVEETIPKICNTKKICNSVDTGTSDSESDSDSSNDDFQPSKNRKTKNVLVKLSNGVTFESPYQSKKLTEAITKESPVKVSIQNNKSEKSKKEKRRKDEDKEEHSINVYPKNGDDSLNGSSELDKTETNKSSRRSKKLLRTNLPIYDDINNEEDDDFISKKSKKKKIHEQVDVAGELNGECKTTTTKKNKKREIFDVIENNDTILESYEIAKKKKKKKEKDFIENEITENSDKKWEIDFDVVTENNNTNHEHDITKKKKKKKEKDLEENEITENSNAHITKVKKKKKKADVEETEPSTLLDLNNQTFKKKKKKKVSFD